MVIFAVVRWVPVTTAVLNRQFEGNANDTVSPRKAAALTRLLMSVFIVAMLTAKIRTYEEHLQRHPKVTISNLSPRL